MKFRSPTETPVLLGLTSGHTLVIGPEFVDVPLAFQLEAVKHECIREGAQSLPRDMQLAVMDRDAKRAERQAEAEQVEQQQALRAAAKANYEQQMGRTMPPWRKSPAA